MDTELNLYLAGPMTGHPAFNCYEFSDWAAALRYYGFDVVSPAESDDPEVQWAAYHSSSAQLWLAATGDGASEALTLDDPREFLNEEVLL